MAGRCARGRRPVDRAPDAPLAQALRGDLRDARARARRRRLADESARLAPDPAPGLRLLLGHPRERSLHPRMARRDRRVPAAPDHAPDSGRADRHERAHEKKRRGPRAQSHPRAPRRGTRIHASRRARRRKARAGVRGDARGVEEPGVRPGVDAHPCRIARLEKPAPQRDRVRQRRGTIGTGRAAGQGISLVSGELFPGFKRRRIRTSGAAINLVHGGVGPPLLLLHGYPQTHAIWHRIAPELAKRFRVVAADLRGYGDSEKPHGLPDHANYSKRALAQDRRCFRDPATIHASCEDYRAAESIDLAHDEADIGRKVVAPLLVLWGKHGTIARCFSPLADWAERAETVHGRALDCGHYIPEEAPVELLGELVKFLS